MEVVFIKVGSVHGRITVTFVCERSSDLSSATIGSGFEIDASNFNIQIYFQYVTGLFAFICDTSLLKKSATDMEHFASDGGAAAGFKWKFRWSCR